MKSAIEKVGKLAAKTKRAGERNMVGPTPVPLEVLDAILELFAGQKAIAEQIETVVAQVERLARGVNEDLRRRVAKLEEPIEVTIFDDRADLLDRISELETTLERRLKVEREEKPDPTVKPPKYQALSEGYDEPDPPERWRPPRGDGTE